jgi:hypothetical protein
MTLLLATFATVFLLGFQQQNVVHGHYALASVTSFLIATAQFAMIRSVSTGEPWEFVLMGGGGAAGVTLSMVAHRKLVKRK